MTNIAVRKAVPLIVLDDFTAVDLSAPKAAQLFRDQQAAGTPAAMATKSGPRP